MKSVFLLQHLNAPPGEEDDIKTIGLYRSSVTAQAAIARLRTQPGFRDSPHLRVDEGSGFYISEYELDKDHWSEGFVNE